MKAHQIALFDIPKQANTGKRTQGGISTSDVIMSAHLCGNANVFPQILDLHVPIGSVIADVTWGKGVFWQKVPAGLYEVHGSDIANGIDCRKLPYKDESFDCVVLDPPYKEGFYRENANHKAGANSHFSFRDAYSNGDEINACDTLVGIQKWHGAVTDMYFKAGLEAKRILKKNGGVYCEMSGQS